MTNVIGDHQSFTMSMNAAFILTLIVTSLPEDRSVLARNLMPSQFDCQNPQYIAVGKQAVIGCSFGIHFTAVYWYNVSSSYESKRPIAGYVVDDMLKIGTEYAEGTMEILLNGDIVIKNVVTQHDGELKVVYTDENDVPSTAYIRVITFVSPTQNHPMIGSCEEADCYQHNSISELIKCSINGIKPRVDMSLVKRLNGEDSPISTRNETTENDDGTFNITISAEIRKDADVSLVLLVCSYNWKPTESKMEASVLLELSEAIGHEIKRDKSVDFVLGERGTLSCSEQNVDLYIWKKVLDNGVPQVVGWSGMSDGKMTDKDNSVDISATGHLMFDRVKLEDEGIYQCVYNDGTSSKVTNMRLHILVTPRPPYPHITECKDFTNCTVHGNHGSLECSLMGVRPVTNLNWECDETMPIELKNFRNYIVQKGTVFDIRVTVDYEVTRAPYCYENIGLRCVANGPVPTHFLPYTEVKITSDVSCKFSFPEREGFIVVPTKSFRLLLVMCSSSPIAISIIVYLVLKVSSAPQDTNHNAITNEAPSEQQVEEQTATTNIEVSSAPQDTNHNAITNEAPSEQQVKEQTATTNIEVSSAPQDTNHNAITNEAYIGQQDDEQHVAQNIEEESQPLMPTSPNPGATSANGDTSASTPV